MLAAVSSCYEDDDLVMGPSSMKPLVAYYTVEQYLNRWLIAAISIDSKHYQLLIPVRMKSFSKFVA